LKVINSSTAQKECALSSNAYLIELFRDHATELYGKRLKILMPAGYVLV
jgi:hypothetical protein